jgi:hypothetical protein
MSRAMAAESDGTTSAAGGLLEQICKRLDRRAAPKVPSDRAYSPLASLTFLIFAVITGSSGAERTTVEALRLEDGLPAWWFESRLRFDDLVSQDGMVFVASSGRGRPGRFGPAQVVALRAHDGMPLWRTKSARIRRRMAAIQLVCGVQGLLRWGNLSRAWNTARSLELAGYTYLAVGDDVVLACAGSVIFAFSTRSGALRWAFPTLT